MANELYRPESGLELAADVMERQSSLYMPRRGFLQVVGGLGALLVGSRAMAADDGLNDTQKANLQKYGYPWDEVYSPETLPNGRNQGFRTIYKKDEWSKIFSNPDVQKVFRKPELMRELMKRLNDGDKGNDELNFVCLSSDEILYNILIPNGLYITFEKISSEGVRIIKSHENK
jgi:hypothetical protein